MDEFEELLQENRNVLERYIKYKINNTFDADDIIQDTCLSAYQKFATLKSIESFKPWLISIAKNKCNDYYRRKAKVVDIPLDSLKDAIFTMGRFCITERSVVSETLDLLGENEKQILSLYFFKNMTQNDISNQLGIPHGTVKSRLHNAKQKFKELYPYQPKPKGEIIMKQFPKYLPHYTIAELPQKPFPIKHEELPGMFIIPRLGESIRVATYDFPTKKQSSIFQMKVMGEITIHDISGVKIDCTYNDDTIQQNSIIFAKLTDTNCKYLGGVSADNNNQKLTYVFRR